MPHSETTTYLSASAKQPSSTGEKGNHLITSVDCAEPARSKQPSGVSPKIPPKPVTVEDVPDEGDLSRASISTAMDKTPEHYRSSKEVPKRLESGPTVCQDSDVFNHSTPTVTGFAVENKVSEQETPPSTTPSISPSVKSKDIGAISGDNENPNSSAMKYLDPTSPPITPESIRHALNSRLSNSPHHKRNTSTSRVHSSGIQSPSFRQPQLASPRGMGSYQTPVYFNSPNLRPLIPSALGQQRPLSPACSVTSMNESSFMQPDQVPLPLSPAFPSLNHSPMTPDTFSVACASPIPRYAAPIPNIGGPPFLPPQMQMSAFNTPSIYPSSPVHSGFLPPPPPWSGYDLLSKKLSSSAHGEAIPPIYRRFEALNHRILLEIQDELCCLEKQLQKLDDADTLSRSTSGRILRASRRSDPGGMCAQQTEVLSNIGRKLELYNKVLNSFADVKYLPTPSDHEVDIYEAFLRNGPIADYEALFLNARDDLLSLASTKPAICCNTIAAMSERSEGTPTPTPVLLEPSSLPKKQQEQQQKDSPPQPRVAKQDSSIILAYGAMMAVLLPVISFYMIPSFWGRMTVVAVVFCATVVGAMHSGIGLVGEQERYDGMMCTGFYTFLMCVLAGCCK